MKISCDKEVDALYIRLLEGEHECHTLRLTDGVSLNLEAGGRPFGLAHTVSSVVIIQHNTKLPPPT